MVKAFYHDFGNEGSRGNCPVLVYKPLNPSLEIVGGRYEIALPEKWIEARLFREEIDTGYRPAKKATKDRAKIKAARKQRNRK